MRYVVLWKPAWSYSKAVLMCPGVCKDVRVCVCLIGSQLPSLQTIYFGLESC